MYSAKRAASRCLRLTDVGGSKSGGVYGSAAARRYSPDCASMRPAATAALGAVVDDLLAVRDLVVGRDPFRLAALDHIWPLPASPFN